MKKIIGSLLIVLLLWSNVFAFCGFYVAGAGAKLYNKSSQVIIARDGDKTVVTMESDFSGDVKQFAMVVPVPTVLKKEQIRVLKDDGIFSKLDKYSEPRIVEYHDPNPCEELSYEKKEGMAAADSAPATTSEAKASEKNYKVKIEAQYEIGEYSILILSAEESDGLTRWLKDNSYSVPDKANEVLEPYIKNKLKFFVVKVNLNKLTPDFQDQQKLRPIQIEYNYNKFMLPIRLGMANATEAQDLTVYAFSKKGRIECANYRTIEIPTDKNIPLRIKDCFADFYQKVFENQYRKANKAGVFVEYAWDLSSSNFLKCDPCPVEPPVASDLKEAGVFWLKYQNYDNYDGVVYLTRLHLRYDRPNFPEDLMFIHTPNKENFQCRYIVTHPAEGDMDCSEGRKYLRELKKRKHAEETTLAVLIGWKGSGKQEKAAATGKAIVPNLSADEVDSYDVDDFPYKWAFFGLLGIIIILGLPFFINQLRILRRK